MNFPRISMIAVSALALGACSSSGGGDEKGSAGSAELGAARAKLEGKPTGALTSAAGARIATGIRRDSQSGRTGLALGPSTGGSKESGGGLGTMSLRPLAGTGLEGCKDMDAGKDTGSCDCETGNIDYVIPHLKELNEAKTLPDLVDMKLKLNACVLGGHTADGTLLMQLSKPKDPQPAGVHDTLIVMNMKLDADKLALAFAVKSGVTWYSQDVDDSGNYVLVKLGSYEAGTEAGSGTYTVEAKNGEFDCTVEAGKGTCEKKGGGESIAIAEQGAPASDVPLAKGDPEDSDPSEDVPPSDPDAP